jgi:CLIP-associating protein 1/2
MAGLTKKIAAQTSQATVAIIISNTSPQPRTIVPLLWTGLQDKIFQARSSAIEHLKTYLDFHGSRAKTAVESSGSFDTLENCIKKSLTDTNANVRQNARATFWSFEGLWKERGRIILETQDGTNRKLLEKACPNQENIPEVQPTTPQVKKSSVAAAIAASRAKAKAIATAPPTLRHQATSAARTMSPPRSAVSPSRSSLGVSGRTTPTSPPVQARSKVSTQVPRSKTTSGKLSTMSHSRNSSGESNNSLSYPGHRVVPLPFSSPPRGSVLRQAMQTVLPSSPPQEQTSETLPTPLPQPSSEKEQEQSTSFARQSLYLPDFEDTDHAQSDLLTAIAIPLPDDADSDIDMDESNHISFSSPYEKFPPEPQPKSRADSQSTTSNGHQRGQDPSSGTGSPPVSVSQPVVEDVLRARAEQAQSAAERLLELVEPEDGAAQPPPSLLLNNGTATKRVRVPSLMAQMRPPTTPVNKSAAIRRQAAAFQDSPTQQATASLMTDMLKPTTTRAEGAWWRKRMARTYHCSHSVFLAFELPHSQFSISATHFLRRVLVMQLRNCKATLSRSIMTLRTYRR